MKIQYRFLGITLMFAFPFLVSAAAASDTIPLSFSDPMFSGLANSSNRVTLQDGGALSNASIAESSGDPTITCNGACTVDHVRVNSREAFRVGGDGTVSISNSYLEANGAGDDHADGIQAYAPGSRGTIKVTNSSIIMGTTAVNSALFVADNWTGTIDLENVVIKGGLYGMRLHPDTGGDNTISLKDVYFVGPFAYGAILLTDVGGHKNIITKWENVRNATIVNGKLVPGDLIPCPLSSCGSTTSTPAPTTPTTPASTKFSINSRVQVVNGPLNVRTSATTAATLLGSQANGSLGTVAGGPVAQGGYVWWNINYDTGADGWSVENYLTAYAAPSTSPTTPTTTTPSPSTSTAPTVADKKRPTKPAGLRATADSASQISLAWSASGDNVGVTGYEVFRNGKQVGTATDTKYSDTGLSASTAYKYQVRAVDAAGNRSYKSTTAKARTLKDDSTPTTPAPVSSTSKDDSTPTPITTPAPSSSGTAYSVWNTSDTPAVISDPDTNAVELGMKFSSNTAGAVTGVRFYKGPENTGTHTGSLWSASGTRLATGTFASESASGWQTLMFSSPVSIAANTTYVVSYHTNAGRYAGDKGYFASARTNGPITAPKNAGVYKYGAGGFPNQTYESSNYWVDVLFVPSGN